MVDRTILSLVASKHLFCCNFDDEVSHPSIADLISTVRMMFRSFLSFYGLDLMIRILVCEFDCALVLHANSEFSEVGSAFR